MQLCCHTGFRARIGVPPIGENMHDMSPLIHYPLGTAVWDQTLWTSTDFKKMAKSSE